MKKEAMALAIAAPAKWIIPDLLRRFGKTLQQVRGNVFNLNGVNQSDVANWLKSKGIREGSYMFNPTNVYNPLKTLMKVVLSESDVKENKNAMVDTLVGGALNSLRSAFSMTSDAQISGIVGMLEAWLERRK